MEHALWIGTEVDFSSTGQTVQRLMVHHARHDLGGLAASALDQSPSSLCLAAVFDCIVQATPDGPPWVLPHAHVWDA
jgi:hypothetical protein